MCSDGEREKERNGLGRREGVRMGQTIILIEHLSIDELCANLKAFASLFAPLASAINLFYAVADCRCHFLPTQMPPSDPSKSWIFFLYFYYIK